MCDSLSPFPALMSMSITHTQALKHSGFHLDTGQSPFDLILVILFPVCKGQLFTSSWQFPPLSRSPPSASLHPGAIPNGFQNSVFPPTKFSKPLCLLSDLPLPRISSSPQISPLSTHTRPRCHATRTCVSSAFIVTLTYQWHFFFVTFCLLFWYCCLVFWSIVFMMVVFINQLCKVLLRAWKAAPSSSFLPSLA